MKRLSRIQESIWRNISQRSEGIMTRKEDNINKLNIEGFFDYLKDLYVPNIRSHSIQMFPQFSLPYGQIDVPLFEDPTHGNNYIDLCLRFNNKINKITWMKLPDQFYKTYPEMIEMPEIFEPFDGDKYIFDKNKNIIKPKREYFKNSECIEIIDVFLNNVPDWIDAKNGPLLIKKQ